MSPRKGDPRSGLALAVTDDCAYRFGMAAPVHLIFGMDEFLVTSRARAIVNDLVAPESQAVGLETIDGRAGNVDEARRAVTNVLECIRTPSMFGDDRVVWFRDVNFLSDTATGKSASVKEQVEKLAATIKGDLMAGLTLVISAGKVDKRYAFYKACKAVGETQEFAVSEKAYLAEREALDRAETFARKLGLRMSGNVLRAFMERVGTDTRQIVNELRKLRLYVGERGQVNLEDIRAVVCASREAIAWDLTDAVGNRELQRSLQIVRQLLFQKESPIRLIMSLEGRMRELIVYRQALDEGWLSRQRERKGRADYKWARVPPDVEAIFSDVLGRDPRKTHPFRVSLLAGQANRFRPAELRRCRQQILEAHEKLVSSSLGPELVLELLLVRMLADAR